MLIAHGSVRLSKDHECINDTAVISHFWSMTRLYLGGQYEDIGTVQQQTHILTTVIQLTANPYS